MPRPCDPAAPDTIRHATTVAVAGRGLMIIGPSGSGKSSLALLLMAHGAGLVADDRTRLWLARGSSQGNVQVWADAPASLPPMIEARGVGLLPVVRCGPVPLAAVADLGTAETARLPAPRHMDILGRDIALFHAAGNPHFAYAMLHHFGAGAAVEGPHDQ